MSFPNIPNITPIIDLSRKQVLNLLLASIALEELGLAHIINAEAEKIQFVLGTLDFKKKDHCHPTLRELLQINRSVERTLRSVIKKEILLQFKLEEVKDLIEQKDKDDKDDKDWKDRKDDKDRKDWKDDKDRKDDKDKKDWKDWNWKDWNHGKDDKDD